MGGGAFFGLLMMGLILLGVILVRVVRGGPRRGDGGGTNRPFTAHSAGSARRLLDERYARGELSTGDYQDRLRVLGQGADAADRPRGNPPRPLHIGPGD